jgi:hypothetical protein
MSALGPDAGEAAGGPDDVRHALKNDHAVALGYVELLLSGRYGDLTAEQRFALEEIQGALRRAHHRLLLVGDRPPARPGPTARVTARSAGVTESPRARRPSRAAAPAPRSRPSPA